MIIWIVCYIAIGIAIASAVAYSDSSISDSFLSFCSMLWPLALMFVFLYVVFVDLPKLIGRKLRGE